MAWEAQKTAKTMECDGPGQLVLWGMVMLPRRRQSRNLALIRSCAQHQSVLQCKAEAEPLELFLKMHKRN